MGLAPAGIVDLRHAGRAGAENNTTIFGVRRRGTRLTSSHAFDTHAYDIRLSPLAGYQSAAMRGEDLVTFALMRLAISAGVARLIFTNGDKGNPIDGRFCNEISEAAIQISEARDVRAVLIAAEGRSFSVGGDVKSLADDLDALPLNIKRWTTTLHSAVARLQRMDAPIVAAVQ